MFVVNVPVKFLKYSMKNLFCSISNNRIVAIPSKREMNEFDMVSITTGCYCVTQKSANKVKASLFI